VRQFIVRPEDFAEWFTKAIPGAYRSVTAQDVQDMTTCGLIGKYGFYGNLDLEMVRCILLYEQLRQNRQKRDEIRDNEGIVHCRRCGVVLVPKPKAKQGRPSEYCADCEPFRGRERYRKWRSKQDAIAMS
jgi:hypothetical protein